jgi:drug/metabolite transporter (DMT)-like permease
MICVTLSALSQLIMKVGMSSTETQTALAKGIRLETFQAIAVNGYVLLGLAMYVIGAGFWLLVLSKSDVSLAYPFVGIGFIIIMLLGWLFLQENIGTFRVLGTLLIAIGVYLVSQS